MMRSVAAMLAALAAFSIPSAAGADLDSAADLASWWADASISLALDIAERTDTEPTIDRLTEWANNLNPNQQEDQ